MLYANGYPVGGGGSGGTGGHTIIDENGNSMTARAGLQFVGGANVSDDATNNKTIVDLASAGGIDGVFVDTGNVIVPQSAVGQSPKTYTATEDCIMWVYLVINNNNASVSVDGNIVFYASSLISQNAGQTGLIPLKKGQTATITVSNYTDSQYTVYGIQTGTTHSKFQPVIYSFEEREIGVWTDGKPLYEKTIHTGALSTGSNSIAHNITNAGSIIKAFGKFTYSSYENVFPFPSIGANNWNVSLDEFGITNIGIAVGSSYTGAYAITDSYTTIQYTKSSDTAGSGTWTPQGVPAVHYSTDEQIIGTWIDGSTLYEKTFYIHDRQFNSSGECAFDVTSLNSDILMADNMASYYTFSISSTEYVRQFEKLVPEEGHVYAYGPANRQIETGYITIRYTKSS